MAVELFSTPGNSAGVDRKALDAGVEIGLPIELLEGVASGLFAHHSMAVFFDLFGEFLPIPAFSAAVRKALLDCGALDWSKISPAIFGAMFQSVMNEQERHDLGAHYTSEENIHKDDPAMMPDVSTLCKVNVSQFYGIEIGAFPSEIAKVALWLMDHLCNLEVADRFGQYFARIPIKASPHIVCANALTMDRCWWMRSPVERRPYRMRSVGTAFHRRPPNRQATPPSVGTAFHRRPPNRQATPPSVGTAFHRRPQLGRRISRQDEQDLQD